MEHIKPEGILSIVAGKKRRRGKHVARRTCVGCRKVEAQRELVRLVRTADGVQVDLGEKLAGRGAYLHDQRSCWQRGLGGALAQALKTNLTTEDKETLAAFLQTLPADSLVEK